MKNPRGALVGLIGLLVVMSGVSGCTLFFLAAVLPQYQYPPPLPELTVILPGAEIPPELAVFAGGWATKGGTRTWVEHILVVEKILSTEDVTVVFAIGGTPGMPRAERVKARFEGDKLVVGSGGWEGVYRIQNDGLSAELGFSFRRFQALLHKTELAELRKKERAIE